MKERTHLFATGAKLTLATVVVPLLFGIAAAGQITSTGALRSTTFAAKTTSVTASCTGDVCSAEQTLLPPITVQCASAIGKTCTLHITMNSQVLVTDNHSYYRFLVDGVAPVPGPQAADGTYQVSQNEVGNESAPVQSYPAAVVAAVTNATSKAHTVQVNIGCSSTNPNGYGCIATAAQTQMRIDVFTP